MMLIVLFRPYSVEGPELLWLFHVHLVESISLSAAICSDHVSHMLAYSESKCAMACFLPTQRMEQTSVVVFISFQRVLPRTSSMNLFAN